MSKTPPSAEYILGLLQEGIREHAVRDRLVRMFRRVRFLEEPVTIPSAYKATATEVRVPSSAEINWRIAGTLQSGSRVLTVPPASGDPEDRETANELEVWTVESRRRIAKQQNRDIDAMMTDAQIADGMAWSKMLLRTDSWYSYPARAEDESAREYNKRSDRWKLSAPFPIYHRDLDLLSVYEFESGDGIEAVVEVSYRPRRYLDQRYPYKVLPDGRLTAREVGPSIPIAPSSTDTNLFYTPLGAPTQRFIEYWERPEPGEDWGWAVYMVGSDVVRTFKHHYGRVPYFRLYGQQTSSSTFGYQSLPVLFPYYWGLVGLNALLTMKMNASFFWAYPIPMITQSATEGAGFDPSMLDPQTAAQLEANKIESGKLWRGKPGQMLSFLANPGTIVDLDETISYLQNQLDRLLAPVLYGIGGYQQPGYTVSQLQNSALTVFRPLTDNQELYYEETTEHEWRLVELWGEEIFLPVPGRGRKAKVRRHLGIGPKDIDGYYANTWELAALLPADKMARGQWAMQMFQGLGLPKRWAIEEGLQEPDAEGLVSERQIEDWMSSPQMMAMQFAKFMQQAGYLPPTPGPVQVGGGGGIAATMPGGPGSQTGLPPETPPAPSQQLIQMNQVGRQRGRPAGVGRTRQPQPRKRPVGAQALR